MNAIERRVAIYNIIATEKTVEVSSLASRLNVSTMTIRRDLAIFEKQGIVNTSYGAVTIVENSSSELSFFIKENKNIEIKDRIARKACEYIKDGETIILDSGSTILQMMKHLQNKRVVIITNSCPMVNFITNNSKVKIILAPGEYNEVSAGTLSSLTVDFFNNLKVDRAFISTLGCDSEGNLSTASFIDGSIKEAIFKAGKRKYLLIDHTKFDKKFMVKHGELKDFDKIITDEINDIVSNEKFVIAQ